MRLCGGCQEKMIAMTDDNTSKELLVSVCALVDVKRRILISRRPASGPMANMWEFPGGKIKRGECPTAALVRELKEELGIGVTGRSLSPVTFTFYRYVDYSVLLLLYLCRTWEGPVMAREGQKIKWLYPADLAMANMLAADEPLIHRIKDIV